MSLADAIKRADVLPPYTAAQQDKKAFSERLSKHLAQEIAAGMRAIGFAKTRPLRGGPSDREFQGGLGSKRVDVSYSDERHGLLFAVSVKTINFPPFGKNLKNRFGDLCTEAITLHMRFPYAVVCALFAFPANANEPTTSGRSVPTFTRATELFRTIAGRRDYTDAGEKFEDFTLLLYEPFVPGAVELDFQLVDAATQEYLTEERYFAKLLKLYNSRNPHAPIQPPSKKRE